MRLPGWHSVRVWKDGSRFGEKAGKMPRAVQADVSTFADAGESLRAARQRSFERYHWCRRVEYGQGGGDMAAAKISFCFEAHAHFRCEMHRAETGSCGCAARNERAYHEIVCGNKLPLL